jgi:hypothetical protein
MNWGYEELWGNLGMGILEWGYEKQRRYSQLGLESSETAKKATGTGITRDSRESYV